MTSYRQKLLLAFTTALLLSNHSYAKQIELVENPVKTGELLKDSWVVNYEINDFDEKVRNATVLYIPQDFGQQAAFMLRCKEFFSNFTLQYTEQQKNLMNDGELPNASSKFAKHGYIYDDEQQMTVTVDGDSESYDISVGGQNKHLTKLFKTDSEQTAGLLGMSLFHNFTFKEMPSFRSETTNDAAAEFFEQANKAINNRQTIKIELQTENDWQRQFEWDTKRMTDFVPAEVVEFCLTKRKLK